MSQTRYTEAHEYVTLDGDIATVGISNYAQEQLGDIVFIELPEIGRKVKKGEEAAVVESVKAASEIYAPVTGEVVEVNGALDDEPELVNKDPEGNAWFLKLKVSGAADLDGLMDADAYAKHIEGLA